MANDLQPSPSMPTVALEEYIPVGTLRLEKGKGGQKCPLKKYNATPSADSPHGELLKHPALARFARLHNEQWARFEFRPCPADPHAAAIARVYLFPDDKFLSVVARTDPQGRLGKDRRLLLSKLDLCDETWHGRVPAASPVCPGGGGGAPAPAAVEARDPTLLQLFNSIPSPRPDPQTISNPDTRHAMLVLLNARLVEGLGTELHPYQQRSAATMLQRESEPGKVMDPRLTCLRDREGGTYYLDHIAGTLRRSPRHYDEVSGGILAEEMGTGKTLICLALILATRRFPLRLPEVYRATTNPPARRSVGSLMDMAASSVTRNGVPWMLYYDGMWRDHGMHFANCVDAILRNPPYYTVPAKPRGRPGRGEAVSRLGEKAYHMSTASIVVVPANLLQQWLDEIAKHTTAPPPPPPDGQDGEPGAPGLSVITLTKSVPVPPRSELLFADIILFSLPRFENLVGEKDALDRLRKIHFKRIILDEGHKLGNAGIKGRRNIGMVLDRLRVSHRWAVTGTPSKGLYGTGDGPDDPDRAGQAKGEREDLDRLGTIATCFLKARPWSNTSDEMAADTPADWKVYLRQPRHGSRCRGTAQCLRGALGSLVIRHRVADLGTLLPPVAEKVVFLDGSYQDRLTLNIFYMTIIFNAVQSERKDVDYFFHPRQRKSLTELVRNMRQSSFYGGSFFPADAVARSIDTAVKFLDGGKARDLRVAPADVRLMREAVEFGRKSLENRLRGIASRPPHEIPLLVRDMPSGVGHAWALDWRADAQEGVLTAPLLQPLQRLVRSCLGNPTATNTLLNGGMVEAGAAEKRQMFAERGHEPMYSSAGRAKKTLAAAGSVLAGNTTVGGGGESHVKKPRGHVSLQPGQAEEGREQEAEISLPEPLKQTRIVATASAKLSYLVDSIMRHQVDEQLVVFYDSENTAWYVGGILEVLQVPHLIYARGLTVERRTRYINSFNSNPYFRVLLMDISQAAFGLDLRGASRVYFVNPVLNPQVEAQAIGRVRRISQQKAVTVESLVLRGSIDEVVVSRRERMSAAAHRRCKSLLDDQPIKDWIENIRLLPLDTASGDGADKGSGDEMAWLAEPQLLFGRHLGLALGENPDEGLVPERNAEQQQHRNSLGKRVRGEMDGEGGVASEARPTARVKFGSAEVS